MHLVFRSRALRKPQGLKQVTDLHFMAPRRTRLGALSRIYRLRPNYLRLTSSTMLGLSVHACLHGLPTDSGAYLWLAE